jgi:hypothetical protein
MNSLTLLRVAFFIACGWGSYIQYMENCIRSGPEVCPRTLRTTLRMRMKGFAVSESCRYFLHRHLKTLRFLYAMMYPKVSGLAALSENWKWYGSLSLSAVVSLFWLHLRTDLKFCFLSESFYWCYVFILFHIILSLSKVTYKTNLCSSFSVRDRVSQSYKTVGKVDATGFSGWVITNPAWGVQGED